MISKIKECQLNVVQLEGRLEFFKFSDDKNPLKRDAMKKVEQAQEEVAKLKDKKKRVDLAMKEIAKAEAKEAEESENSNEETSEEN